MGAVMMVVAALIALGSLGWLMAATVRSISDERTGDRSLFREFGLSMALITLFFASWIGQAITQWQEFTDEQASHGAPAKLGDFMASFGQSTLENWQSEFLQVFVFIVLTTFLVHRKSHESPDTDYDTEAALRRIEAKLDRLERERTTA